MSDRSRILMEEAIRARLDGRLLDAHRGLVEALAINRNASDRRGMVQALKGLAQVERDLGRAEIARPLYEEAITLCRSEDEPLQLAHTVRHLGDTHQDLGHPELAERCYREALVIYRGDTRTAPLDLANTLRPLAMLYEGLGRSAQAIELWTEARDLYDALGVSAGVAESRDHLSALGREYGLDET